MESDLVYLGYMGIKLLMYIIKRITKMSNKNDKIPDLLIYYDDRHKHCKHYLKVFICLLLSAIYKYISESMKTDLIG